MAVSQLYTAVTGDTITAARWNNEYGNIYNNGTDVAFPLTKAVGGGGFACTNWGNITFASGRTLTFVAGAEYWAKGADIASAASVTIGTDGNSFHITGTTTITAFVMVQTGHMFVTTFDGALTLTHNATSFILPNNGSNITTAAGDRAIWIAETTANARCIAFMPASGQPVATVSIAKGGTNSTTALSNSRAMVSSGGAIVEAGAMTNGQLLIGSTGVAPVVAALTAGTGVTITNGAGSITVAATGAITAGTALTQNPYAISTTLNVAHGLAAAPSYDVSVYLECLTAENGFSVGDRVWHVHDSATATTGYQVTTDATNTTLTTHANLPQMLNKTTQVVVTITAANWKIVVTPYRLN